MKKIILLFLSLSIFLIGQAQFLKKINNNANVEATLSWTKFTTVDGLPSNAIKDVIFDKDGNLWIATSSGVSKYNGTTFQNYTVSDGLHSNAIGRMYCDHLNRIWAIGDYSSPGLSVYNNGWQTFNLNNSVSNPGYLFQDAANNIYIVAGQGNIYKYNSTQIDSLFQAPDKRISSAIFDLNGIMWVISYEKLLKYSGNTLVETKTLTSNGVGSTYIIEKDKLGKLWILMGNSLYKSDDLSTFNLLGTTTSNYYMDVAFDSQNNIYLGRYSKANGGIKTYVGTTWGAYAASEGLTGQTVQAVAIGVDDKVWVGADDGLYRSSASITSVVNINKNNYIIYPNPVLGAFRIKGFNGVAKLTLMDLNGKTLIKTQVAENENILLNFLPGGLYFLKLETSSGVIVDKLVKQ